MKSKLSKDIEDFLEKASTRSFLLAARGFVDLLEDSTIEKEEFLSEVHLRLLDLYMAGYKLEEIDLNHSSEKKNFVQNRTFENKNAEVISKFGNEVFYWEVFNPIYSEDSSTELGADRRVVKGWIADDFADIYRDLKIELVKIDRKETDEFIEDALWQLKWSFLNHWGQHCIDALRYLHYLNSESQLTAYNEIE